MNYSRTVGHGSARDEALKRRNAAMREVLGMGPKPEPMQEPERPAEQKADVTPSEPPVSSQA
jgi:hypothetical protein